MATIIHWLHWLLVWAYWVLPVGALIVVGLGARRGRAGAVRRFVMTVVTGALLGVGMCWAYALAEGAAARISQMALASYLAVGLLVLLRLLELGLRRGLNRLFRVEVGENGQPLDMRKNRTQLAVVLRLVLLVGIGLPYTMVAMLTYRPRAEVAPQEGNRFQRVDFQATDGTALAGWWFASNEPGSATAGKTVLLCHGLGASKAEHLVAVRVMLERGYNVLAFDFRAHGESAGQLVSFGAAERYDVLGAVRWLRAEHPAEAKAILGLGINLGAAALLAAAAEGCDEGQAIDAVAAYGCYDELKDLSPLMAKDLLVPPLRWLMIHVGLPLASVQVGEDLRRYAPGRTVADLWPRPVLFVHGQQDRTVDFQSGWRLFHMATQPKDGLWPAGDLGDVLESPGVGAAVETFFADAQRVPVI